MGSLSDVLWNESAFGLQHWLLCQRNPHVNVHDGVEFEVSVVIPDCCEHQRCPLHNSGVACGEAIGVEALLKKYAQAARPSTMSCMSTKMQDASEPWLIVGTWPQRIAKSCYLAVWNATSGICKGPENVVRP